MTTRRPHWDEEVFEAVAALLQDVYENGYSERQVYDCIAAVEDWQARQRANMTWGSPGSDAILMSCSKCGVHTTDSVLRTVSRDGNTIHMTMFCKVCSDAMDSEIQRETPIQANYSVHGDGDA